MSNPLELIAAEFSLLGAVAIPLEDELCVGDYVLARQGDGWWAIVHDDDEPEDALFRARNPNDLAGPLKRLVLPDVTNSPDD